MFDPMLSNFDLIQTFRAKLSILITYSVIIFMFVQIAITNFIQDGWLSDSF